MRTHRILHNDVILRSNSVLIFIDPQAASVVHTNGKTVSAGSAHGNLSLAHQSPGAGDAAGNRVVDCPVAERPIREIKCLDCISILVALLGAGHHRIHVRQVLG